MLQNLSSAPPLEVTASPPGWAGAGIGSGPRPTAPHVGGLRTAAVGCGGFVWIQGWQPLFSFLKTTPFDTFATYSFSVIPLFLLALPAGHLSDIMSRRTILIITLVLPTLRQRRETVFQE